MKKNRILVLVMLLSLVLSGIMPVVAQDTLDVVAFTDNYLQNELPQGWGIVKVEDLATELIESPPFLVDVRQPEEVTELGYISGAINVPVRELAASLDQLPADLDANIVVYCKSGTRGTIGMIALQMLGYTNVRNLSGGILAWIGADYEVATDPMEVMSGEGPAIDPDLVARMDDFLVNGVPQGWGMVSTENLFTEMLESQPFLIDVREPAEWDELGYIAGAINIPVRQLAASVDMLPEDKDTPIVVYCKSGTRGTIGMVALQFMGYTNVRNMSGGIMSWLAAGYEVEGAPVAEIVMPEGTVLSADEIKPLAFETVEKIAMSDGFGTISVETLHELMADGIFILDVREDNEWAEGFIPGAIHVPLRQVAENLQVLPTDKSTPIVIYCAAGQRGAIAQFSLAMLGYDNLMNLRGGVRAWDSDLVHDETMPAANLFPEVDADVWATVNAYLTGLEGFGSISSGDFNTLLLEGNAPFILDVREASEYEAGFIAGAVNAPTRSFVEASAVLPDTDTEIVVYGSSGPRGATVMTALQMLGYNARNLSGGSAGWVAAGFELVTE